LNSSFELTKHVIGFRLASKVNHMLVFSKCIVEEKLLILRKIEGLFFIQQKID